jgi:molybdopterin synthase catalytic subunit
MMKRRRDMGLYDMISRLKAHEEASKIGMIASHLGVVRGTSRDGRPVEAVEVSYDHDVLDKIKKDTKGLPGIIDVLVETYEGHLHVGQDILAVAVAGDIREHVFDALIYAVDRIKTQASRKKEFFVE